MTGATLARRSGLCQLFTRHPAPCLGRRFGRIAPNRLLAATGFFTGPFDRLPGHWLSG